MAAVLSFLFPVQVETSASDTDPFPVRAGISSQKKHAAGDLDPTLTRIREILNRAHHTRITARAVTGNLIRQIDVALAELDAVTTAVSGEGGSIPLPAVCRANPAAGPRLKAARALVRPSAPMADGGAVRGMAKTAREDEYVELAAVLEENCEILLGYMRAVKKYLDPKARFISSLTPRNRLSGEDKSFLFECLTSERKNLRMQLGRLTDLVKSIERLCEEYREAGGEA